MKPDINILILEDKEDNPPEKEKILYKYIDVLHENKYPFKERVRIESITKSEEYKRISSIISKKSFDIAILDYNLALFGCNENGWIYVEELLKKNRYCKIILTTALATIGKEVNSLSGELRNLISEKPNIKYIPKDENFTDRISAHVKKIVNNLQTRWILQEGIFQCAVDSYKEFMDCKLEYLIGKPDTSKISVKEDTLNLDIITEVKIRDYFIPKIHEHNILICTEEGGVENKVIYRIDRPAFYVFSDPLDGSNAFEKWVKKITIEDSSNKTKKLKEIINEKYLENWEESFGPKELNSPMISIVLTERHHVVGNVLVNIFTGDIYFSIDSGNYKTNINEYNSIKKGDNTLYDIINESMELKFRKTYKNSNNKLLICTLQSRKCKPLKTNEDLQFYTHFIECLSPNIPDTYDLEKSFEKRKQRNDFTPGPGRILYLTEVAEKYSSKVKDANQEELYSCILSSGEPITEWVGWLAFLRHVPHLSIFCLRTEDGNVCHHQIQRDKVRNTMMPQEVASLFKNGIKTGMMDFEILHTGYKDAMQNYTDSIVVFFNTDESWTKLTNKRLDKKMLDLFVKIEP